LFALILRVRRLSARIPGPASSVEACHPQKTGIVPGNEIIAHTGRVIINNSIMIYSVKKRFFGYSQNGMVNLMNPETYETRRGYVTYNPFR
jgi:hypothetical protein